MKDSAATTHPFGASGRTVSSRSVAEKKGTTPKQQRRIAENQLLAYTPFLFSFCSRDEKKIVPPSRQRHSLCKAPLTRDRMRHCRQDGAVDEAIRYRSRIVARRVEHVATWFQRWKLRRTRERRQDKRSFRCSSIFAQKPRCRYTAGHNSS